MSPFTAPDPTPITDLLDGIHGADGAETHALPPGGLLDLEDALAEALAADVQRVLADDGVAIAAHTAGEMTKKREG